MKNLLPNVLVVLGVCAATLGASAMHEPHPEAGARYTSSAWPLFGVGLGFLAAGGIMIRSSRRVSPEGGETAEHLSFYREHLERILRQVVELDDARGTLRAEQLTDALDRLMRDDYFDLTSRSDDLVALLGFDRYAKVWEGIATAERLLGRCWSMTTDGHQAEGMEELPHARRALEQSSAALAAL